MTDWMSSLQTLAVPVLLTVSMLVLIIADLLTPAAKKPGDGDQPTGNAVRRSPMSFRDIRAAKTAQAAVEEVATGRNPLGILAALLLVICLAASWFAPLAALPGGAYVHDAMTVLLERLFLVAGILAILGASAHVQRSFWRRQGEFYALLLCSLIGMTLLAGSRDLLLLIVAFELMGIPLYVLATYAKTDVGADGSLLPGRKSVEAGLKFYLVGALSSAISLYGISLLVGLTGTTHIADLAKLPASPLLQVGTALVVAGFGFKLGLAPFQFWIPDTYEGAPTPVVSFFSVAPKVAGMLALAQILLGGLLGRPEAWLPALIAVSVATMAAGNFLALPQTHLKRLLGNSGVAQMGTMLLGLFAAAAMGGKGHGLDALLFYTVAYLAANTGLFLVIEALGQQGPVAERDTMASLSGLNRRSPGLALAALVCLLSLAGIPFAVGFWAKLFIFMAAWQAGYAWLVLVSVGLSVVALFYYLRVARSMYLGEPTDAAPVRVDGALKLAVLICALATAGMGLYPRPLIEAARVAAHAWMAVVP